MSEVLVAAVDGPIVPVRLITEAETPPALAQAGPIASALARLRSFKGQAGQLLLVPGEGATPALVLFGVGSGLSSDAMLLRQLPSRLPAGDYRIEAPPEALDASQAAAAFALGSYGFDRYKAERGKPRPRLVAPPGADLEEALRIGHAAALARDMVNTPAADMGPLQIESIAREIAEAHRATVSVTTGDALLEANYPAIHAVGRAAAPDRQPRLVELTWGAPGAPVVAVVGKGVAFDTGGLNLKPGNSMRLMKKDMGGAAHALALARLIMGANLPVRLVTLLPVVENAVSADAFRPGDILNSRKGLTIEVGNTDAEGRLILADALTRAGEHQPTLTVDFATLTGAARVALGPQLPPLYTDDEGWASAILDAADDVADPVWRMPLWRPYAEALNSDIADLSNDGDAWAQAGSVVAALFLQKFAPATGAWVHFDVFAWNPKSRPGSPVGGELQAVRAVYAALKRRYRG
jgi:leucyl aminopeptidase